jgi:hypothetical protein
MTDIHGELDAALDGSGPIARDNILRWIDAATDLLSLSKLYRLTGEHYYRIQPDLGADAECLSIQRYLLECIRLNVEGDEEIASRWEAAETLHLWLRHLLDLEDTSDLITKAARSITNLFLTGGEDVRIAIEQGFLEHALETAALRPYFEHWSSVPQLRDAWDRALEWGKAHPDYAWNLVRGLPPRQKRDE